MNESKIEHFVENQNVTNDRTDKSIKSIKSNSFHDCSRGGKHILELMLNLLKKIDEQQKNELNWFKSQKLATKLGLKKLEGKIMSKISEFAVRQNAFNDRMDVAVTDLQGDVKTLNDTIVALQATSGSISTEDQSLLDQIEVRASGIADKLDALDTLTSPSSPTGSV